MQCCSKFFKQALNGETLEIYGDGKQTRDFIYIDDLIQAIMLAINPKPLNPESLSLNPNPWGEVFQIATYKETTVNEIVDVIKNMIKKEVGRDIKVVHTSSRLGDVKRNYSDISKARGN
ncbi:MAG: NAD-dependent epimerase/dehydratase family protein [Candidatus Scalinduaceae bacterium]